MNLTLLYTSTPSVDQKQHRVRGHDQKGRGARSGQVVHGGPGQGWGPQKAQVRPGGRRPVQCLTTEPTVLTRDEINTGIVGRSVFWLCGNGVSVDAR